MAITSNSIDLVWTAATDNVGVVGYYIDNITDSTTETLGNVLSHTVTGLTPDTEYSFTHRAFDLAGNISSQSNIVTARTLEQLPYLFFDEFDGTTIDLSKWVKFEEVPANLSFSQNNDLIMSYSGNAAGTHLGTYLRGVNPIDLSIIKTISFDIITTNQQDNDWQLGITKDLVPSSNIDVIRIGRVNSASNIIDVLRQSSTNTYAVQQVLSVSTSKTFKITNIGGSLFYYYWSGSWTLLGSVAHSSSGNWYPMVAGRDIIGASGTVNIDNYFITDTDFGTQYPYEALTSAEVDQYLIDADNGGAYTNGMTIDLSMHQPRTSASDTAVSNLVSNGITVITS